MVNGISYQGRVVNTERMPIRFGMGGDLAVLALTIAETHQMKKGRAKKDPNLKQYVDNDRNIGKTDDDYIDTTTTWHKLTVFGEKALEIAQDEDFNHGAIVQVTEATYVEEGAWKTRDGVERAGRPESISEKYGSIAIHEYNGRRFGAREPQAIWDGVSEIPKLKGQGGGAAPEMHIGEDEGF